MSIKQLNASYLVNEDRILFRFNTQDRAEYRLWFTRRVTLFILAATSHLLTKSLEKTHSSDAAKALHEFGKQTLFESANQQNQQNNSSNEFESGLQFPIGADPLLVMDVTCSLTQSNEKLAFIERSKEHANQDILSIDFMLPGGANLNLKLSESLVQGMSVLLDQIRKNAGWGEAVLVEKNVVKNEENIELKSSENISIH